MPDLKALPYRTPQERRAAANELRRHLRLGGLIAYPTETVYGLGCALLPEPLERLALLKERGSDQPFLVLIRSPDDVPDLAWTDAAHRLARTFWPGPLTLALADPAGRFPGAVRSPWGTVAVRVSPHPAAADILAACDGPVTSTSANRAGEPPATDARTAAAALQPAADVGLLLDGGPLPPSRPSTILDCTGARPRVLRAGALPVTEIEQLIPLEHD